MALIEVTLVTLLVKRLGGHTKFKDSERLRKEWWELTPKLQLILCDAAVWAVEHGVELVVTCLMRSAEEQAELVANGQAKSKTSVHMYGRGGDGRLFTNPNLNLLLCDYINTKYPYDVSRPNLKTVIAHEGTAFHFHFQSLT